MAAATTTVGLLRTYLQDNQNTIWPVDDDLITTLNAQSQGVLLGMSAEIPNVYSSYRPTVNPLKGPCCLLDSNPTPIVLVNNIQVTSGVTVTPCGLRVVFTTPLQQSDVVQVGGAMTDIFNAAADLLEGRATAMLQAEVFNTHKLEVGGGSEYRQRAEAMLQLAKTYRLRAGLRGSPDGLMAAADNLRTLGGGGKGGGGGLPFSIPPIGQIFIAGGRTTPGAWYDENGTAFPDNSGATPGSDLDGDGDDYPLVPPGSMVDPVQQ